MAFYEFIKGIDIFGKEPELYIKGKTKQVTLIGRIITAFYIIIYIIIFCYKLYRMFQRVDITFYDSYLNTDEMPNIKITKENFSLAFSIIDKYGQPFINESIYYPEVFLVGEEGESIRLERCDLNNLGAEYKNIFEESEIYNYYCLTDINYILKPFNNSIRIELYPCESTNETDDYCAPKEFIDQYLDESIFKIYFHDIILTPFNYNSPVKEKIKYLNTQIYKSVRQYLYTQMQLVKIETSNNIFGFDFLTNPKTEEFIKFDNELMLPYPGFDWDNEDEYYPLSIFEIQLNDKILFEKRQYIQLIDVLGEIGGLMEIIFSFFGLICSLIVDTLYGINFTNNLFSFNVSKKLILTKTEKNSMFKINKTKNKEEQNLNDKSLIIFPFINKKKKKEEKTSNMKILNKDIVSISSKSIIRVNSFKNEIKKESIEILPLKNSRQDTNKNKEKSDNTDKINKIILKNKDNWIITNISLKDLFISRFYCCKGKKRKVFNLLLNESMEVIMEKLDIFNIFRNICSIEYSNNNLKNNLDVIKMSEKCSKILSEIIK